MNIKTIDLEKYKQKDGWYEIDLFPQKSFEKEIDVLLYDNESCGNVGYYYIFDYCNKNNIKVKIYTTYNLFPIASLIGHTVILQPFQSGEDFLNNLYYNSKITRYRFDKGYAWEKYKIKKWTNLCDLKDACSCFGGHGPLHELYKNAIDKAMLIDARGLEIFLENKNAFPSNGMWVEYSRQLRQQSRLMDWVVKHCDVPVYVASKNKMWKRGFQEEIILNYEGSKYLLTYQMLCSLYNNIKYSAIGGAASLFSISPFINCVLMSDLGSTVSHSSGYFKSLFNKNIFNENTYNFPVCYGRGIRANSERIESSYGMLDSNRLQFIKTVIESVSNKESNLNFTIESDLI